MTRYLLFWCFCLGTYCLSAQSTARYPQGYFRWPLSLAPEIVANMGELRDNHWHMGLDIRTNQKVNQLVYASAEGYIAYAGIRPSSFGRFIMINHPNGLSTLYGHLNDFFPELEAYVTAQQYQKESWAVELTIPEGKFPVKKGSFIAYSGTTGGSQGPHVHFEIRDTKTGECLNPLLFGMPLQDKVPPSFVKLALYDRSKSVFDQTPRFFSLKNTPAGYIIPNMPVLRTPASRISFGLQAFDRISGSANQDGIYSARLFLDDVLQVGFSIDSIDYNETRYMNAHIDYKYRAGGGAFFQHLSLLPGDRGNVYHPASGDGVIFLDDTEKHDVRIEIMDSYKNKSILRFSIRYDAALSTVSTVATADGPVFIPGQINVWEKPGFEVVLPEGALYDTVRPVYSSQPSQAAYAVSALHQLNDESIPIHENLRVRIKPDRQVPLEWRDRMVIRRTYRSTTRFRKAAWEGEWLSAGFDDFGTFQAFGDITAPTINSLGSGDTINLSASSRIVFTPTDNSGIESFRAELDDQWLRFTNDKSRSWIYIFDERCPYGVHKLKVTVKDIVGNTTTRTWWFKKYPYTPPKKVVRKKSPVKRKTPVRKKK